MLDRALSVDTEILSERESELRRRRHPSTLAPDDAPPDQPPIDNLPPSRAARRASTTLGEVGARSATGASASQRRTTRGHLLPRLARTAKARSVRGRDSRAAAEATGRIEQPKSLPSSEPRSVRGRDSRAAAEAPWGRSEQPKSLPSSKPPPGRGVCGEGGIRTLGRLLTYVRLASGYLRPLGHLSGVPWDGRRQVSRVLRAVKRKACCDARRRRLWRVRGSKVAPILVPAGCL